MQLDVCDCTLCVCKGICIVSRVCVCVCVCVVHPMMPITVSVQRAFIYRKQNCNKFPLNNEQLDPLSPPVCLCVCVV